ncbi:MAG: hypothetical protein E6H03_07255, partial [Bacillati bacterium ANGP1]
MRPARPFRCACTSPSRRFRICATGRTPTSGARSTASPAPSDPPSPPPASSPENPSLSIISTISTRRSSKHAIPCGVGTGETLRDAYLHARDGDPISAFGGIVALNRPVDEATADAVAETFLEAVIAPGFADEAQAALARKKNLRLMDVGALPRPAAPAAAGESLAGDAPARPKRLDLRRVREGLLVQDPDTVDLIDARLRVVTSRAPTEREWSDLRFAWTVCRFVRSNAVVFARGRQVVGIGAGQMNRVEPVRLAAR